MIHWIRRLVCGVILAALLSTQSANAQSVGWAQWAGGISDRVSITVRNYEQADTNRVVQRRETGITCSLCDQSYHLFIDGTQECIADARIGMDCHWSAVRSAVVTLTLTYSGDIGPNDREWLVLGQNTLAVDSTQTTISTHWADNPGRLIFGPFSPLDFWNEVVDTITQPVFYQILLLIVAMGVLSIVFSAIQAFIGHAAPPMQAMLGNMWAGLSGGGLGSISFSGGGSSGGSIDADEDADEDDAQPEEGTMTSTQWAFIEQFPDEVQEAFLNGELNISSMKGYVTRHGLENAIEFYGDKVPGKSASLDVDEDDKDKD